MDDRRAERLISDHALLRYMERVHEIEVAAMRRYMATMVDGALENGARHVRIDGVWFAVKGGRVATVLPGRPGRPRREG